MFGPAQPGVLPPPVAMLDMIKGFWVSRALYVAAKLGIPDLLRDEPKSSDDLAQATGTHAPSLYRVLRALDSVGVFAEDDRGRFALTPLGATLRTDIPGSLRYLRSRNSEKITIPPGRECSIAWKRERLPLTTFMV
jgi:hypothetical protein